MRAGFPRRASSRRYRSAWALACHTRMRGPAPCFDREGQALALRLRKELFYTVVRGPSHATRACERVSLAASSLTKKGKKYVACKVK